MTRPRTSFARSFLYLLAVSGLAGACSGGGCSSGCGGITPLPGGFVNEERIENAAGVRITESGFDFLEANIGKIAGSLLGGDGSGIVTFPINETQGTTTILFVDVDYTVCPGGPDANGNPPKCVAEIDIANADLSIQPQGPHNIVVSGVVPLRLQQLPFSSDICDFDISMNGNGADPGEDQTFAPVNVTINLSIETDLNGDHARQGYSRARVEEITISQSDIENAIHFSGGFCADIVDFAKGLIVGQLFGGLQDTLKGTVEEQLCQKADTTVDPPCPNGTNNIDGVCRYGTDADSECVSMVLGMDGHADLSGLLASLSPGTKGGLDFLFALGGSSQRDDASGFTWGDLNPVNNGASMSMFGGVEPNPISSCVPLAELARPSGLKIPQELIDDSLITDWPAGVAGPHLGIGISESFTNYALAGLYNSGLFCIGISTEQVDLLNSGTIGLLAQSLRDLGIQRETQPIAIVIKPTKPPSVKFGNGTNIETDPLIDLKLPQASFDFYMFSSDRYIRFMTATFDIEAPLNLTVTPEGLVPTLETLKIENGAVSNAELLKEDPAGLAASLQSLLSSQIGGLIGGGIPPVDVNGPLASFGLRMVIPESVEGKGSPGLRTLTQGEERYLGIFAALETTDMMANANAMETEATVSDVKVDVAGLRGGTITKDNAPEVTIVAGVADDKGEPIEHQVRIDGGIWRPWTKDRFIQIKSDVLRIEGKHTFDVRSRAVGKAYTIDPTPEQLEVIIDTMAPETRISPVDSSGEIQLDVADLVSKDATLVRYRFDDGNYSGWVKAGDVRGITVPDGAKQIEVEAQDEKGNVGTAKQAIVRGLPHGSSSGCGCQVVGDDSRAPRGLLFGLMGIAALGAVARRRGRARRLPSLGGLLIKSRAAQAAAGVTVLSIAGTFSGCSCEDETNPQETKCEAPGCTTLEPGLIGSYTGADVDSAKNIWVSGYLEAWYESAWPSYGDLVVGKLNGDKVEWEIVDGVPTDPPPDPTITNVDGFRGGQTAPGEDVGIWTSLAINPSTDLPAVSYYDRTNKRLKLAEYDGESWKISVVSEETDGDVGRYSKLVFDGSTPVIAYLAMSSTSSGFPTSGVRIARGDGGGGFTVEDVAINTATPCRVSTCTGGSKCLADEGTCVPAGSSCASCADGEECVTLDSGDACKTTLAVAKVEAYPVAGGLYVALAKLPGGGVGLAYYDRVAGTVNVAAQGDGGWITQVVDGGTKPDGTTTDTGVGTSLFVDDGGTWHLAYVDGYAEAVKYASVVDGQVQSVEVVDEGFGIDGVPFPDGQHLVGDDSNIRVTPQGEVQITYQDATNGTIHLATGTPNQTGGHDWSIKVVDSDDFGGFFTRQLDVGGSIQIVQWGRKVVAADDGTKKGVGDVSILSP